MQEDIRVLRATTLGKKYQLYFYNRYPDTANLNYNSHIQALEQDVFAEVGFWKLNLEKLGNYELTEVYINDKELQNKYAQENNIRIGANWKKDILTAQIEAAKPEVIFEDDDSVFDPEYRKFLKTSFPSIKFFVSWDGYIKSDIERFRGVDLVLTCVEGIQKKYLDNGFECYVLPFAFEETILNKLPTHDKIYDLSFVGNIIPEIHNKRLQLLYYLSKHFKLDAWISNFSSSLMDVKKRMNYYFHASPAQWHKIFTLEHATKGKAFGLEMYKIFNASRITINIHGDSVKQAGNMRLLEAVGAGALLITDDKPNISEYFIPGKEIVVFKNEKEAAEKIAYLLKHPDECDEIAKAGQQKVLQKFSYLERAKQFDYLLRSHLEKL